MQSSLKSSMKHSTSDPAFQRRVSVRSLVRQCRVRDRDEREEREELIIGGENPDYQSAMSGSELSILLPTLQSSMVSSTAIGDAPPANDSVQRPSVLRTAVRMMSLHRHSSVSSHVTTEKDIEGRSHDLLHNVGRTIQRTGSQLRRTRLFHIFYLLVLPVYTVLGAWLFQALDGEHDDLTILEYNLRCQSNRTGILNAMQLLCQSKSSAGADCFSIMAEYLFEVENCYREWHRVNRTVTYSMSDFSNALVYAFSVYTTIGYGNMAADTVGCRVATIFYGAFGIPLFFAFVKEEGNLCRDLFIAAYKHVQKMKKQACKCTHKELSPAVESSEHSPLTNGNGNCLGVPTAHFDIPVSEMNGQGKDDGSDNARAKKQTRFKRSTGSLMGNKGFLNEQRKVFIAGCLVFLWYILSLSWLIMLTTEFDYFTSVYFLFNSVALIGFGDVFPKNPKTILVHAAFMVLGVVLFSMCYFIMQEEIREKAFEASRKARISISKYGHTIMAQARSPWSRRNSPLFDQNGGNASDNSATNDRPSNFERLKKRRQSAPAIALTAPGGKTRFRDI